MSLSMRKLSTTCAVTVCIVLTFGGSANADERIDPEAERIVRQMSDFYRGLNTFSVDVRHDAALSATDGNDLPIRDSRHVAMARPNQLAMAPSDGAGANIVCDGKKLLVHIPSAERYLLTEAPDDIDALLRHEAVLLMGPGRAAAQLAASDPYAQLMRSVASLALLEAAPIDDAMCHRVEAARQGLKTVFWIQQGERPLLRKLEWEIAAKPTDGADESDATTGVSRLVTTLDNWTVDTELSPKTFAVNVPTNGSEIPSLLTIEDDEDSDEELRQLGKAIPAGPNAPIAEHLTDDKLAFNLRTMVDAYKEHGSQAPAWDEEALAFLAEVARHFALAEGYKSQTELASMAEPLLAQGCDDPLVKYCYGAVLYDSNQGEETDAKAIRLIEEGHEGLVERKYPAFRCFAAAKRIWQRIRRLEDQGDRPLEYLKHTLDHTLGMLAEDNLETNDGRFLLTGMTEVTDILTTESKGEHYKDANKHEESSPWLVNMLGGRYHVKAAWAARGNSWAMNVTEEGWKSFSEHMEQAQQCFERAWKAAPSRPEAPAELIGVVMATSVDPLRDMRLWFDRAVEAQLDYLPAYDSLLNYMQPRWHGSHDLIYQFGLECMETQRYDTDVPFVFCRSLWTIAQDTQNPLGTLYWRRPGIYDNAQTVCRRYIAYHETKQPDLASWWKSVSLGFAYADEQWDAAREMLDESEDHVNWDAMNRFRFNADELVTTVRLRTTPQSERILQALAWADGDRQEEARRWLEALQEIDDIHPFVLRRIRSRLQGLQWDKAFEAGEALDLMPNDEFQGWTIKAGSWTRLEDGSLEGVSDTKGVVLQCEGTLRSSWELSGEFEYGESPYAPWDAGVLFYSGGEAKYAVMVNPRNQWVAAGPYAALSAHQSPHQHEGKTVPFVVRMENGVVNVWFGETKVVDAKRFADWQDQQPLHLAIGAHYRWSGTFLTYRNLKIQPIQPDD